MAQFAVDKNRNAATKGRFPLLLDVQSDLLEPLATRAVEPCCRRTGCCYEAARSSSYDRW